LDKSLTNGSERELQERPSSIDAANGEPSNVHPIADKPQFTIRRSGGANSKFEAGIYDPVKQGWTWRVIETTNAKEALRLYPQAKIDLLSQLAANAAACAFRCQRESEALYRLADKMRQDLPMFPKQKKETTT
jgi:hypothetical protein